MSLLGLEIDLHMRPFRIADRIIPDLYAEAVANGNILKYNKHDMRFKYASIKASDHPETEEITPVLLYACHKGDMLIVFEDLVDAMFKEYAAVHEYGDFQGGHNNGTRLEMEIARKEGNLEAYLRWIKENYPQRMKSLRRFRQP